MSTPLFDTLRVTKDLESCGFDSRQSEGIVAAIENSLESGVSTKADVAAVSNDIASVSTGLKADIASVRTELKADIASFRTELKADIASFSTGFKADIAKVNNDISAVRAEIVQLRIEIKADIQTQANKIILAAMAVAAVAVAAMKLF